MSRSTSTLLSALLVLLFASLAGCGGGGDDCNEDSATVQPVECAASGCAK